MVSKEDIRWEQRFANYRKALSQLEKFIAKGDLSELEEQGLIKAFEYTYELAWNTLKDYLTYQGILNITGSRDAIREALSLNLIGDGDEWMNMLVSRNLTSHSYNQETADEIANAVLNTYFKLFKTFEFKFESLRSGNQTKLI
ncbi:nucleotidyltransferase substrate binding protein [Mucilaginibacter sp. dw_454]|uniref:nucleotidyltransferase substrate binding protein n=1 Tax=Mucilaginibacter sp. dw_454 TaxID=2720079 RepID=UPI001BD2B4D8|nr:nucleotidyltransferase substrate binding protein [Mucilaginibacter sp. dw_454]